MRERLPFKKEIGFGAACIVPVFALIAEIFFQIIVFFFGFSDDVFTRVVVVGNQVVFFATCIIYTQVKGISLVELTGVRRVPKWHFFPLFILLAVACVFAFAPLAALLSRFFRFLGYTYTPQYSVPYDEVGGFLLMFFALTVLPAIGEETLMRGVLLSGAKRKGAVFGILFSALAFALFHGNLMQLLHQFLLGCVMAYVVYLTHSVWASMVVHAVNNGVALVTEYLYARGNISNSAYAYFTADTGACGTGAFIGVLLVSWLLLFGVLFLITYLVKRQRTAEGASAEGRGAEAYLRYLSGDTSEPNEEEGAFAKYAPFVLIAVLLVLLLSNILSEVMQV